MDVNPPPGLAEENAFVVSANAPATSGIDAPYSPGNETEQVATLAESSAPADVPVGDAVDAALVPFLTRLQTADHDALDRLDAGPMKRLVMRLPVADRKALDRLRERLRSESRIFISRADLMRFFVWCGLSVLNAHHPLGAQLPIGVLRRAGLPRARPPKRPVERGDISLRQRILDRVNEQPEEVFTPAKLVPLVGAVSTDSVRNTLLTLHAKRRLIKVGPGQYQALRHALPPAQHSGEDEPVTERLPPVRIGAVPVASEDE